MPDRNGKIFYTSITSLSHISKIPGYETVDGGRRCRPDRHYPGAAALRSVRLIPRAVIAYGRHTRQAR
ncbi:hypothetical protein PMZ77_01480 [[Clostridium] symbiosum]|uniref:Uncharacterized protein n=1 Tax=Clostridium symbiosum TaxID=1512 RepID=A0AB35I3V7_CLOSY|nr:hypothetical protein [[Clostridium] symbiosum]MDB1989861.1 hypothetical protein [[Clostridium] symbiosum]MDB1999014.1 hypothetical protein [[Clostridium] symbiosum]